MAFFKDFFFHNRFFRDRLVLVSASLGLLTNIIIWLVLIGKLGYSSEPIPLHFNIVYGIDVVADSRKIYQLPLAGLVIYVINLFLASSVYDKERLPAYFLTFSAFLAQLILIIGVTALLILNL